MYRVLELGVGSCLPRLLLYLGPALLLSILANTPRLLEMRLVTILDTDSGNHLTLVTPPASCTLYPGPLVLTSPNTTHLAGSHQLAILPTPLRLDPLYITYYLHWTRSHILTSS